MQGLLSFTEVGVDGEGLVSVSEVLEACRAPNTVLVTVMHRCSICSALESASVLQHGYGAEG